MRAGKAARCPRKRWLERQLNDPYVARAKREGLRSRAAFKLIEIDDKHRLLKPGAQGRRSRRRAGRLEPGRGQARRARRGQGPRGRDRSPRHGRRSRASRFLQLDFLDPRRARAAEGAARRRRPTSCSPTWPRTPPATARPITSRSWRWRSRGRFRARGARAGRRVSSPRCCKAAPRATLLASLKRDFASVKHVKPAASRADSAELYLLATGFGTGCRWVELLRNPSTIGVARKLTGFASLNPSYRQLENIVFVTAWVTFFAPSCGARLGALRHEPASAHPLIRGLRRPRRAVGEFGAGIRREPDEDEGRRGRQRADQQECGRKLSALMTPWSENRMVSSTASAPTATPVDIESCCATLTSEVARLMRRWSISA